MQMLAADIRAYPRFARYVSISIPRDVIPNNTILNNIQTFAGTIDIDTIKDALRWGQGPMIKITQLGSTDGEFTPNSSSNEIRIDIDRVRAFERGGGRGRTGTGHMVYMVGVILLHELTHWADDQDGVDTPGEEGWDFEQAVYGGVTG